MLQERCAPGYRNEGAEHGCNGIELGLELQSSGRREDFGVKNSNREGNFIMIVQLRIVAAAALAAALALGMVTAVSAQSEDSTPITVELNKLETIDTGCRIYVVVNNETDTEFETLKLDLVLFRTDDIVDQRFFVDLAPLRKQKRIVKLFELGNVKCDEIGSFLVNDVVECRSGSDVVENCLSRLTVSSRTTAKLSK